MLYFNSCIRDGAVAHEDIPVSLFDLSDEYEVLIDVGAHFGIYSVLLGALNDGDLLCFEPDPDNADILAENLRENGIRARIDSRIVSDYDGHVSFYRGRSRVSHSHSTTKVDARGPVERTERECVALSTVLEDYPIVPETVFVKIDAEGEEERILRDLIECTSVSRLSGLVELHLDVLDDQGTAIRSLFDDEGFSYRVVDESDERPVYYFSNFDDR